MGHDPFYITRVTVQALDRKCATSGNTPIYTWTNIRSHVLLCVAILMNRIPQPCENTILPLPLERYYERFERPKLLSDDSPDWLDSRGQSGRAISRVSFRVYFFSYPRHTLLTV